MLYDTYVRHNNARNVFRSNLNPSTKLLWNFDYIFTNCSSFNTASQFILNLYPTTAKVTIYSMCVMASVHRFLEYSFFRMLPNMFSQLQSMMTDHDCRPWLSDAPTFHWPILRACVDKQIFFINYGYKNWQTRVNNFYKK